MRQKIYAALVVVVVIATLMLISHVFYRPIPIVSPGARAEVLSIAYNWENVTGEIDLDKVVNILRNYYTVRTLHNPFPSLVVNETWRITLRRGNNAVTISLGVDNVLYSSASDSIMHGIQNPEALMYELSLLLTSLQACRIRRN